MKVIQLGNGGAFDYDQTNTSFLIDVSKDFTNYLLFDCGYSVFSRLRALEIKYSRELIKYTNTIFISHMDDDHIGSLKTLIYYRYFILQETTNIICHDELKNELKFGIKVDSKKYDIITLEKDCNKIIKSCNRNDLDYIKFKFIKAYHYKTCYGLMLTEKLGNVTTFLYLSGDTKVSEDQIDALNHIHDSIRDGECKNDKYLALAFHDYSNWNSYDQQVHTCEYDWNKYYVDSKTNELKYPFLRKCHTGESIENELPEKFDDLFIPFKKINNRYDA